MPASTMADKVFSEQPKVSAVSGYLLQTSSKLLFKARTPGRYESPTMNTAYVFCYQPCKPTFLGVQSNKSFS